MALKYLPAIMIWAISGPLFAQKTEIQVQVHSSLFSFTGQSAEEHTFIIYHEPSRTGYANNPYGSKKAAGFGLSGNIRKVSKNNFLLGLDAGVELLRSKIRVTGVSGYTQSSSYYYNASGQALLQYGFINLNPFFGYRFTAGKIHLDATGGIDLGYCIQGKEKGSATATNGTSYTTSLNRKTIRTDVRPRLQLAAGYKKAGIYIGYSLGLASYTSGSIGGTNDCYARILRFGLTYTVK